MRRNYIKSSGSCAGIENILKTLVPVYCVSVQNILKLWFLRKRQKYIKNSGFCACVEYILKTSGSCLWYILPSRMVGIMVILLSLVVVLTIKDGWY